MQARPTVSRRSLLSAAAGCFAGSYFLDTWLLDSATAETGASTWQQRWSDGTQRKFTPVGPDPASLSESWTAGLSQPRGAVTVDCVGPNRVLLRDYDRLIAYDRSDGNREWVYHADEGSFSRPTLVGETVVVQENGTVHAVDTGSGDRRWTGSFNAPYQPFANPTTRDGNVYLPTADSYTEVHPDTGFRQGSVDSQYLGTLLAATETQLFWWTDGRVQATDTGGTVQWRRTFGRSYPPSSETLAVTDDHVVFRRLSSGETPLVTALDRESGTTAWEIRADIATNVAITAGQDTVYLGANSRLYAVDAGTGNRQWSFSTTTARPEPVVTPETLYVPTREGVVPVDPAGGSQLTVTLLEGRPITSLAAVDTCLYATAEDRLFGLEAA